MAPKSTVGTIRTISVALVPDGQERNGVEMLGYRGTTATKATHRDPIVAVVHDQAVTEGSRATAIGSSSWVFIAESGAKTRLALSSRANRA